MSNRTNYILLVPSNGVGNCKAEAEVMEDFQGIDVCLKRVLLGVKRAMCLSKH
jgi:hypothetical protein